MASTPTAPEELEYVRSFKAARMTGISRSQFLAWEREGRLKIFRPSPKMAMIRWKDLVALIEGKA
jgi:hypothetical protein